MGRTCDPASIANRILQAIVTCWARMQSRPPTNVPPAANLSDVRWGCATTNVRKC
jgi:hypothetical protein